VRYRNAAGRTRKLTLTPGITLAAARKLTAEAMLEVAQGRDPGAAKQEAKRSASAKTGDTIERWAGVFVERHAKKHTRPNSWRQTVHVFEDIVLPAWKGRRVGDIKRKDVRELLEDLAEHKPIMANRVRGVLSKFYNWMCERDDDLVSPVIGVKAPAAENVGERVLDDDELRRLWKACEAIGGREGACIKLLILTGQRRGEISHLRWYPRLTGRPFPLNRSAKENAANRSTTISTAGSPPPPRPWPSVAWTIASPISLRGSTPS